MLQRIYLKYKAIEVLYMLKILCKINFNDFRVRI